MNNRQSANADATNGDDRYATGAKIVDDGRNRSLQKLDGSAAIHIRASNMDDRWRSLAAQCDDGWEVRVQGYRNPALGLRESDQLDVWCLGQTSLANVNDIPA